MYDKAEREGFGIYSADLMVTDNLGNISFDAIDISVDGVLVLPTIWLFSSGLIGLIGLARRKAA